MRQRFVAGVLAIGAAAASAAAPGDQPAAALTLPAGLTCPVGGMSLHAPPTNLPRYSLAVHVQRGLHAVTGALSLRFAPEQSTDRLVFRLWPNERFLAHKGARLTVGAVRSQGQTLATARPNATTLVVRRALAAGEPIVLSMAWRLRLPRGRLDRLYGGSIARLGSFFPLLAWDPRRGWQTDAPSAIGWETWTSPTADFDVRVTTPRGLRVLASGKQIGLHRWRAHGVRDFALAVGRFKIIKGWAAAPERVRLTMGVERGTLAQGRRLLANARAALEAHAHRFGPYPWGTFTVVASDMDFFSWEYPTLVFETTKDLNPRRAIAHEIAHQWFYSLVGNNQARDPWLDEALATWAQARYSNNLAELLAIPIPDPVRNRLGQPMTFWDHFEIPVFIDGVYTQGVQALASLGPAETVDCALRLYIVQNAYATADPADLLRALESFFPGARQTLETYGVRF